MSCLLAFKNKCKDGIEVSKKLGVDFPYGTADKWLETTQGSAFRSSVGKHVMVWSPDNLNIKEKRAFGKDIWYILG
jgi:hypothetical protein